MSIILSLVTSLFMILATTNDSKLFSLITTILCFANTIVYISENNVFCTICWIFSTIIWVFITAKKY